MDVHVKEKEDALLGAYRAGDVSAFDGLVELYSAKLYRVAYMLLMLALMDKVTAHYQVS